MNSNLALKTAWRFLWQSLLALVCGVISTGAASVIIESLSRRAPLLRDILIMIYYRLGYMTLFVIGTLLFFLVYFVLFNWRWFYSFQKLNEAVTHIAQGHFDDRIESRGSRDIRALADNVNQLVARLKMSMDEERKAEQTKNELVTNVSHDLRTPLTSILGYLGLIDQDRYRDEVELRYYIQIAYEKAQRLNTLIQDLFEYTRMRHDAIPLRLTSLDLAALLGQLLAQYRLQLSEAGMEGRVHADGRPVVVRADPDKLVRLFENLLSNAMQYGRDGKRVDVYVRTDGDEAVAEVVNYGEPISSADLPHVFDRFYRVDKSRADHSGGSGLGLAIAKGIVVRHGGSIDVASGPDATSFQVRLPLVKEIL